MLALGLALAAGLASGQAGFEISGTVEEPAPGACSGTLCRSGTATGVPGAEVTLSEFVTGEDRFVVHRKVATALTDGAGAFRFRLDRAGNYYLEATKTGYAAIGGSADQPDTAEGPVSITAEQPQVTRAFQMTRPAELTGNVIDENGDPVADLPLLLSAGQGTRGVQVTSDAEGKFTASRLLPGAYTAQVTGRTQFVPNMTQPFREEEWKKVGEDWEHSYWPGGGDLASALPLTVAPGAVASMGTIRVRRVPYYRAHVTMGSDACASGTPPRFWAVRDLGPQASAAELRALPFGFAPVPGRTCSPEFLVINLRPGNYWFTLFGEDGKPGRWALAHVEITNANVEVPMTLMPTVTVPGRLVAAEGSELPSFKNISVRLGADLDGLATSARAAVGEDGTFAFQDVQWPRRTLIFEGLLSAFPGSMLQPAPGLTHYVEAIRYNGVESTDGVITLAPGAELQIVVDDQPASLSGTVQNGNSPAPLASAVLVRWPITRINPLAPYQFTVRSDGDGKFTFTGLPPGEYRALAVPFEGLAKLGEPGMLTQLAASAERVELDRGGSQTVKLKLVDPGR